jgi:hypothetical protein
MIMYPPTVYVFDLKSTRHALTLLMQACEEIQFRSSLALNQEAGIPDEYINRPALGRTRVFSMRLETLYNMDQDPPDVLEQQASKLIALFGDVSPRMDFKDRQPCLQAVLIALDRIDDIDKFENDFYIMANHEAVERSRRGFSTRELRLH